MTGQILPFVRSDLSVITEMTGHFFLEQLVRDFVRDTLKALEIVQTAFNKRLLHFLTDDNLITTLCSVYIQLHQSTAYLLIDIKS